MAEIKRPGCFVTAIGIIGIIWILGLVFKGADKINEFLISPKQAQVTEKADQAAPQHAPDRPKEMTPSENLAEAKRLLAQKSKDTPHGFVVEANIRLKKIPEKASEYDEAQKLLRKTDKLTKALEKEAAKNFQAEQKAKRLIYGPLLEGDFLDKGYDIYVKILGKDATTLHVRWALVSRPYVHSIGKDHSLIQKWKEMGFKKAVFSDGYRSWEFDLTK